MAERDITKYSITHTDTSINLGNTTYMAQEIDLTQDFGLQRVARGLDTIGITSTYSISGVNIDPDSSVVNIEIYDVFNNLIIQATETRQTTGQYLYSYVPAPTAALGIYRAIHSCVISGSAYVTEDFFKIVSTNPGSYYGYVLRGEDTVTATLSSEALSSKDIGTNVLVQVKSPTGVIVSSGNALVDGSYSYSPGYNDYDGDYQMLFTYYVNGSTQQEQQFFTVVKRREENLVTATELKKSMEFIKYRSFFEDIGDDEVDNIIADAQAMASQYVGYNIGGSKLITGEVNTVSIDQQGFLYIRPRNKNITKLIRCILRFHPMVSITLQTSGFLMDPQTGTLKYVFTGGMLLPGSIKGILNEYSYYNWYESVIDYETGWTNNERQTIKRAIRLLALDILQQGYELHNIKELKAGNYTEQYFDFARKVGDKDVDGLTMIQKQAYVILKYFQRAPIV